MFAKVQAQGIHSIPTFVFDGKHMLQGAAHATRQTRPPLSTQQQHRLALYYSPLSLSMCLSVCRLDTRAHIASYYIMTYCAPVVVVPAD
jgi:hypothetical protein